MTHTEGNTGIPFFQSQTDDFIKIYIYIYIKSKGKKKKKRKGKEKKNLRSQWVSYIFYLFFDLSIVLFYKAKIMGCFSIQSLRQLSKLAKRKSQYRYAPKLDKMHDYAFKAIK